MRNESKKNLTDLGDMIDNSREKIAFIEDFFSHGHAPDAEWFSRDGELGFYHILADLQDDLKFVSDQMGKNHGK